MTTSIPTGRFVWFDYVTKDPAKAAAFYGEVFNWKTQQAPTHGASYMMFTLDDQPIGGLMPTPSGGSEQSHWLSTLQVKNARTASDQIQSLGGKVLKPAHEVGDVGTSAVVADPLGGAFALWQPARPQGTGDFKGQPNTWCWNELYTDDPAKSVEFYSKVGGFTEETMQMKEDTYHVLNAGGQPRAGIMKSPMPMPQAWMPYVQVTSVDQTVGKAKQLGATVHVTEDVPGIGRIGIFSDPLGGMIGVLTPAAMPA